MSSPNINEIDENKIPIKYILGIQENTSDFPTALDILYIFISRAVHQPDRQKDTFTRNALTDYQAKGRDTEIDLGISEGIQKGYFESVNETIGKESYRILINPFI
jgi:hypothetical protein|tara:strand:+ start:365 stop:679 length:315 start_codon:yes stop_codon:yes gene_type:complete